MCVLCVCVLCVCARARAATTASAHHDHHVFVTRYAAETYSGVAYLLSKTLVEIPTTLFQITIIQLILYAPALPARRLSPLWHRLTCDSGNGRYWLCGIEAPFVDLVLVCTLLGLAASSTSLLLGAVAGTVEAAMQLMPLALVPQLVRRASPCCALSIHPRAHLHDCALVPAAAGCAMTALRQRYWRHSW